MHGCLNTRKSAPIQMRLLVHTVNILSMVVENPSAKMTSNFYNCYNTHHKREILEKGKFE